MSELNLFISQPMSGLTYEEFDKRRKEILEKCNKAFRTDYKVINPYNRPDAPKTAGPLWYLGKAIMDLDKADIVIFSSDSEKSNGCKIERRVCTIYGLTGIDEIDLRNIAICQHILGNIIEKKKYAFFLKNFKDEIICYYSKLYACTIAEAKKAVDAAEDGRWMIPRVNAVIKAFSDINSINKVP